MEQIHLEQDFRTPICYENTYVVGSGVFMPGAPVDNESIDAFIAPINLKSDRIKRRILRDNGIQTRHYAIDETGKTLYSVSQMAARAVAECLDNASVPLSKVTLLCTGTSGGDTTLPGFANMLQGEIGAQPLETSSHQGVCAAGVAALKRAASAVERGEHDFALVATSELPSRLFKKSRFAPSDYNADFDSHFLRWMLSDGSGAMLLGRQAASLGKSGVALKLKWVHMRSFSGDFPVCMQVGLGAQGETSYLDYESFAQAEQEGAYLLRQDIRLLPHLFDVGIHEYARLASAGSFVPEEIDHFLCHYSSEKFRGVIEDLMEKAALGIPPERWYSNLTTRGNTGAASIFVMLHDFVQERELKVGQKVLCFVPESGRFTVSFIMLEVVDVASTNEAANVPPPHGGNVTVGPIAPVLRDLADIWHDYRSRVWRSNLIRKITRHELTLAEYCRWMACWIPQVREGTVWMRRAVDNMDDQFASLRELVSLHAKEEQFDYRVLFSDYQRAGGDASHVDALRRNAGGEALNSYMHQRATQLNPVGLLGAVYIIEGTGQRIIPALLPMLREQIGFAEQRLNFLRYHAENDPHHLQRWLDCVTIAIEVGGHAVAKDIVRTARDTAQLYALQMECVL
jgi:3-oxoacyl-[acyl-carrier-protein] synthase-3